MEPKKYQRAVLDDLSRFLALLGETGSISTAYSRFWEEKKVIVGFGEIQPYQNVLPRIPNVCLKVPTGGGKTFIASCAIKPIFDDVHNFGNIRSHASISNNVVVSSEYDYARTGKDSGYMRE